MKHKVMLKVSNDTETASKKSLPSPSFMLPPAKKVKHEATASKQSTQFLVPIGTQWQNNSCVYDAMCTVLFNVWQENPELMTQSWQELHSGLLNSLLEGFWAHTSFNDTSCMTRYSLEQICNFIRWHLVRKHLRNVALVNTQVHKMLWTTYLPCLMWSPSPYTNAWGDMRLFQMRESALHVNSCSWALHKERQCRNISMIFLLHYPAAAWHVRLLCSIVSHLPFRLHCLQWTHHTACLLWTVSWLLM